MSLRGHNRIVEENCVWRDKSWDDCRKQAVTVQTWRGVMANCYKLETRRPEKLGRRTSTAAYDARPEMLWLSVGDWWRLCVGMYRHVTQRPAWTHVFLRQTLTMPWVSHWSACSLSGTRSPHSGPPLSLLHTFSLGRLQPSDDLCLQEADNNWYDSSL